MRIFYAADSTPNQKVQSNLWRHNLYEPLVELGHEVVELEYDMAETFRNLDPAIPRQAEFIRRNRPRLTAELLRQIRAAHAARPIDLFFSYFYDACVLPEAIEEIRSLGITTVNWYCNGAHQFHLVSEIAPHYDWCLVPERFRLEDYRTIGARPIYCQEAANPTIYHPYDLPLEFDVTFVGAGYGDRPYYVRSLLDRGIDVRVWGPRWEHYSDAPPAVASPPTLGRRLSRLGRKLTTPDGRRQLARRLGIGGAPATATTSTAAEERIVLPRSIMGGPLSDEEMIRTYSRSKINLGFSSCGETHASGERIMQIRLRDFEVPMSGGFYMVEYMEELEEFFEIGREIVCYADADELADKIGYYLRNESEREAIRRAGYERARRDHTWHRRFRMAFAKMGLAGEEIPTGTDRA